MPQFLHEKGVEGIVAGGMGRRAMDLFKQYQIRPFPGVFGKVEAVISDLLNGTLESGESLCQLGLRKGYGIEKSDAYQSKA